MNFLKVTKDYRFIVVIVGDYGLNIIDMADPTNPVLATSIISSGCQDVIFTED